MSNLIATCYQLKSTIVKVQSNTSLFMRFHSFLHEICQKFQTPKVCFLNRISFSFNSNYLVFEVVVRNHHHIERGF